MADDSLRRVQLVSTDLPTHVSDSADRVKSPADSGRLIASFIGRKDREHFVVIHLTTLNQPSAMEIISNGDILSAPVHPREVFKGAVLVPRAS